MHGKRIIHTVGRHNLLHANVGTSINKYIVAAIILVAACMNEMGKEVYGEK